MDFSVTMPALGESVSEGTVTRWLKSEGDHVNVDEPLLEVSTDKVDTEIPSPVAGTLTRIVVAIDQTVPVGAELAIIADSAPASVAAPIVQAPVAAEPVVQAPVVAAPVTPPPVIEAQTSSSGGTVITMPALGESVSEGTVTRWLKNVGDNVAVDEALLEVSTDKVDTEIPSPVAGVLLAIDVTADTTVAVGARLALIGTGASAPVVAAPVVAAPVVAAPVVAAPVVAAPVVAAPVVAAPVVAAPV
ncbi:MAG: 2-oxoglutarate dehydrogenase, E2 component, dihydrolipoamide succinyltransferase, partial [Actinobacteria bacterium]|nr:2-oxoglutarate dehydrogenase, E2 component, dihydrolipoamide succinyltransferase [Actinomycetota bacterium]